MTSSSIILGKGRRIKTRKEGEMPPIFKALATITVWILFIWGCVTILSASINWLVFVGFTSEPPICAFMGWGLGAVELILAVVVMRLRQKME